MVVNSVIGRRQGVYIRKVRENPPPQSGTRLRSWGPRQGYYIGKDDTRWDQSINVYYNTVYC